MGHEAFSNATCSLSPLMVQKGLCVQHASAVIFCAETANECAMLGALPMSGRVWQSRSSIARRKDSFGCLSKRWPERMLGGVGAHA